MLLELERLFQLKGNLLPWINIYIELLLALYSRSERNLSPIHMLELSLTIIINKDHDK